MNILLILSTIWTLIYFKFNKVSFNSRRSVRTFRSVGIPIFQVKKNGRCSFGNQVSLVNTAKSSTLGRCNRCKLLVYSDAQLIIGNKVGMSNTTIVATKFIRIGNNVMIGGGSTIVDSDFHSLNPEFWHTPKDEIHMKSSDVIINDNVFIGMNAIILKGVNIGSNVIIAAGSVVTKDIPDFEIWGGNPAKFIRKNS